MNMRSTVIVLFVAAACLLWWPFHTQTSLYSAGAAGSTPAGEILEGFVLEQRVRAGAADMTAAPALETHRQQHCFGIRFATYRRSNGGRLDVGWRQGDRTQQWRVSAARLVDNKYRYFCPDQPFAAQEDFDLRISGVDGQPGNAATLWLVDGLEEGTQDAALAFMNFINNPENAASWHQTTGYIPITNESVQLLEEEGWFEENPNSAVAGEQLEAAPDSPATAGVLMGNFVAIRDVITGAIEDVLVNDLDPAERFDVVLCPPAPVVAIPHDHSPDFHARTLDIDGTPRPYLDFLVWSSLATGADLPAAVAPVMRSSRQVPPRPAPDCTGMSV
ncbi:MAG: extracellular solute-binding protein [Proteobacteria bacterium]|nr:extracellular solute-binding protein [Pseudomonadota bacterium]